MGNFHQIIFGVVLALFVKNACEAVPITQPASSSKSDHHHGHDHSQEEAVEAPAIEQQVEGEEKRFLKIENNNDIIIDPLQPDNVEDLEMTNTKKETEDEKSTISPTQEAEESESDMATSGPRRKRDEYGHSHCYGGEWRWKGPYWGHGHWHEGRWVWQRPHCHYYYD